MRKLNELYKIEISQMFSNF